jgi:hypothetical protein
MPTHERFEQIGATRASPIWIWIHHLMRGELEASR